MAAMLVGRGVCLPKRLFRALPKVSWIRILSSDSNENGEKPKISISSLRKDLERSTTVLDLSVLKDRLKMSEETPSPVAQGVYEEVSNDKVASQDEREQAVPILESSKEDLAIHSGSKAAKEVAKEAFTNEKMKKSNRVLKKNQKEFKSPKVSAGSVLSLLRESAQEPGEENKSLLEKSIKNTRHEREELRRSIMDDTINPKKPLLSRKRPPHWIEKSLEDFDSAQINQTTAQLQTTDPKLKQKIKDVLSELQVGPSQQGTGKSIVAAAEHWGKPRIKARRKIIDDEYLQQTRQNVFEIPSWLSLDEGEKTDFFDSIISKAKLGKVNTTRQSDFLFHLKAINRFDNNEYIRVWKNAFTDQMRLSDRLWKYPIDNEVCKVEEENTSFEEHVFLEYLLDDFPSKGPVRRFMELVINGLQKNPFMTVAQKKERVGWFRDYFANFSKEELNF